MTREASPATELRSGYVAIVGRPNVGKSTLLNHILGQKISITSRKPQTTRHQILGIKTVANSQVIYVDTPGIHGDRKGALNRYMNRAATSVVADVDLIVFVVERTAWTAEDELVLEKIAKVKSPVLLAINKVDLQKDKDLLLPHIDSLSAKHGFVDIVPISAQRGDNVDALESRISELLPLGRHYFPADQVTDRSSRFMAAEIVREKIMRRLGDEVPYQVTVEIEQFKQQQTPKGKPITHIDALILVQRAGQKKIIIGNKGEQLKQIGRDARVDMEAMFETKVMLKLWVKVKTGWADDERALRSLGYDDR